MKKNNLIIINTSSNETLQFEFEEVKFLGWVKNNINVNYSDIQEYLNDYLTEEHQSSLHYEYDGVVSIEEIDYSNFKKLDENFGLTIDLIKYNLD